MQTIYPVWCHAHKKKRKVLSSHACKFLKWKTTCSKLQNELIVFNE